MGRPMSDYAKQRLGEAMKVQARLMQCPKCGRGAALKATLQPRRVWCRWTEKGLCDYEETPDA